MAQIRKKPVLIRTAVAFILAFSLVGQTPDPVLRSTTRLIQLNVMATDRSGKRVTDLTLDEIVLTDAGKKQNIALFTPELASPAITPAPAEPGTVVLSDRSAQTPGAVTAILFDSLNTALLDQSEARKSCDSPIPSDLFLRGPSARYRSVVPLSTANHLYSVLISRCENSRPAGDFCCFFPAGANSSGG